MNGEIFRTVFVFRQHVAAVDPSIIYTYNPYRVEQVRIALLTLFIMKIEMFEDDLKSNPPLYSQEEIKF